jgi:hypothetical protein
MKEDKKIKTKSFKSKFVENKEGGINAEKDFALVWGYFPGNEPALRFGEKPFLDFFVSKNVSGWAEIANKKLKMAIEQ